MKKTVFTIIACSVSLMAFAQTKPLVKPTTKPAAKPTTPAMVFKNSADSASYALGVRIAQNLKSQGLSPLNSVAFQKGMADALQAKKPLIADELLDNCIGTYQQKISSEKSSVAKKEGQAFLAANGKRSGVVTLPSGLQYEIIKAGPDTAVKPTLASTVKCHYHGTTINGTPFDSSVDRGEPISFPLGNVIVGWQEALQLMSVGSKWKLYIPADMAYGDRQQGDKIPPGSTLIFVVELLGVENK
jgi:FKBP-type peptidyl-prolyl cis-trans isomerase FklB